MKFLHTAFALIVMMLAAHPALAHVGSQDVFEQISVGQYKLFVTIRPPNVIPGVATVEVRSTGASVTELRMTPMPMDGGGTKYSPKPDVLVRSATDPAGYSGKLWLMVPGSWRIRMDLTGADGARSASIPIPALVLSTLRMQRGLGLLLAALGLFLVIGMASLVASAVREATLWPGLVADRNQRRRSHVFMWLSLGIMALILWRADRWWNVEAAIHRSDIYSPLVANVVTHPGQLDLLVQAKDSPVKLNRRSNDDFIADHGHLMHLYAVRMPTMDAIYHLHPILVASADFQLKLPSMPVGTYTLYGDVVHANGLAETIVSKTTIVDDPKSRAPMGDDAGVTTQSLEMASLGPEFRLPDGYKMSWTRPESIYARTPYLFHFELLRADGHPASDVQPYMGMPGHAAFIKSDGSVFAHVHPEGSAAMAALMLANGGSAPDTTGMASSMPAMQGMQMPAMSNIVEFPYGFPSVGRYRIVVQMKHGDTIETGVFDAQVQ